MLNLNSTIEMDFKSFLRWWRRELEFLIPEKIKRLLINKQGFIIVSQDNGYLSLSYSLNGETGFLTKLHRGESSATQYKELLANSEKLSKAKIVLRLTRQEAVQKELVLPAAARENLQQVVAYELDRYTPFKADDVYFAIKATKVNDGQIKVLLILTSRAQLDALYEELAVTGIIPVIVDYEGVFNNFEDSRDCYNLLPERLRPKTAKTSQLIHSTLIGLVLLLLTAVLVMPVWFQYKTVSALEKKVKVIEQEAKKIKTIQSEIDALMDETSQLINEKNSSPPVVDILNTLSRLMKDDTWLAYIQFADGHLQLQGESPEASSLIGVLESSDLFDNAVFVSPVTQDSISKLERFQISVDVSKKGGTNGK